MTDFTNQETLYTPLGNVEFAGQVKIKNTEITNQQFFNSIFTQYASFTLPVYEEKKFSHIQINLYSDAELTNLIKTIDTTNSEDRKRVCGIDASGFFNIPEEGFNSSYQGKPVFVDLQDFYHLTNFISWRIKIDNWKEKYYSIFPLTNIDNYGNGKAIAGGNSGGSFEYRGYFATTDISDANKDIINISSGIAYLNNKKIKVDSTDFELLEYTISNLIDVGEYHTDTTSIDVYNPNYDPQIRGELKEIGKEASFPCEIRLVISSDNQNIVTQYTLSKNNRNQQSTDALIATINKNDDGTLDITQQCFGEIDRCLPINCC